MRSTEETNCIAAEEMPFILVQHMLKAAEGMDL
jgi:hypothetical protein